MPLHSAFDLAALRTPPVARQHARPTRAGRGVLLTVRPARRRRSLPQTLILVALAAAALLLLLSSTNALGATLVTPKCDNVNLRTGPGTTYTRKAQVDEGARLTVVAKVSGASYGVACAGAYRSGSYWFKINAINGTSAKSLFGVSYVYGASKLFKTLLLPAPSPTATPTAAPTTAPTSAPSSPPTDPGTLGATVTFYGRGYGHGIGLSQYGAQGRAADGQPAAAILAHYYQGTTLGTLTNRQVRVLVLQSFAATVTNPVQVYGRDGTWTIDGVNATFPADARLRFTPATSGTTTTWKVTVTAPDGSTLYNAASGSSIRVRPGTGTTLQLWSKPSAYDRFRGVLRLIGKTDATAKVNVVNELLLESYLRGVVPAEVPANWPAEAVKAQAIAARSYAAYHLHPNTGTFDLYADTRSQMYLGRLVEKAGSDAAVSATAGVVLRTPGGGIANALFHSTGGGATENNENVFTSSTGEVVLSGYSYLRGSSDRRPNGSSYDAASPYATWSTKTYTLAQIQAWFAADSRTNVGTLVALDLTDRGVSGRLISVTLIGADGTTKQVASDIFRAVFNAHRPSGDRMMRSTLFDLAPIP